MLSSRAAGYARFSRVNGGVGVPQRILLVEDDWFLADVLATSLREKGWLVDTAGTVAEALAGVGKQLPDLLLLDLRLPDGDAWTILTTVRQREPSRTPVVLVSSYPVTRSDLRRHDVTLYMPKPFRVPDLLARLSELLGNTTPSVCA
jgi:two-component system OmpR family response regulator